eukprot:m.37697 g.37697  ORF g.37697 m.37697 type:complete len:111 (-) comp9341_c0_seq1:225-557(-)
MASKLRATYPDVENDDVTILHVCPCGHSSKVLKMIMGHLGQCQLQKNRSQQVLALPNIDRDPKRRSAKVSPMERGLFECVLLDNVELLCGFTPFDNNDIPVIPNRDYYKT